MVSLIIEGTDENKINQYLTDHYYLQNLVSEVIPENDSIGLPAIKYLIDRAKFSHPDKNMAVFLIRHGHLITHAGQNALLKTLEESRPWQQFIITTYNHHLLLDTITSRCQIKNLSTHFDRKANPENLKTFVTLIKSPAQIITNTDRIISENPKAFLTKLIEDLRLANRHFPTKKRIQILNQALQCLSDLERNINPKLALDHFLLKSSKLIANTLK